MIALYWATERYARILTWATGFGTRAVRSSCAVSFQRTADPLSQNLIADWRPDGSVGAGTSVQPPASRSALSPTVNREMLNDMVAPPRVWERGRSNELERVFRRTSAGGIICRSTSPQDKIRLRNSSGRDVHIPEMS